MQPHTDVNPLLDWILSQGSTPYAQESVLVERTGLTHRYIGDIATDKRQCEIKSLVKIQRATEHQVTAAMMIEYWHDLPQQPHSAFSVPTPAPAQVHP